MPDTQVPDLAAAPTQSSAWTVFLVFLRLGFTSFGGPIAHIGYFRDEFVTRRRWLNERTYADLVALCQFLPGPASSQVGLAVGLSRAGYAGALAAWLGFTLPSAVALIVFALGIASYGDALASGALQGLKIVAVAVVAQAVWGMAKNLCPDPLRAGIMTGACGAVLLMPSAAGQVLVIASAALLGLVFIRHEDTESHQPLAITIGRTAAIASLVVFVGLLFALPVLARLVPNQTLALIDAFYRAGSLVFGGGHVVLPLLQAEVVPTGWVTNDAFLAGYGAAQAVPGPLFTFAAFLGASLGTEPTGWTGGMICLVAIFVPSFLLVFGALPFWESVRHNARARSALSGINAAVVGLLVAALYQPVWTSAIHRPQDFVLGLIAFVALMFWKLPPWLVVLASAVGGWMLSRFY